MKALVTTLVVAVVAVVAVVDYNLYQHEGYFFMLLTVLPLTACLALVRE